MIYLNDSRATLNDTDFVIAAGTLNLRRPYDYSGNVSANVANLATFQPLLRAAGNQNALAGAVKLNWEGQGQAVTASQPSSSKSTPKAFGIAPWNNSGNLKLVLEKARYGNLQGLQANIDASGSPEGLDVPTIFFATTNMDFNAIARTKGDILEIDKIQLNQIVSPQPQRVSRSSASGQGASPYAVRITRTAMSGFRLCGEIRDKNPQ